MWESKEQVEKSKVAIQSLRKCHSLWDRANRDWQGVIKKSEACPNTQGTKIESDIEALISTASAVDGDAMALETQYLTAGVLTDAQIAAGATNRLLRRPKACTNE